MIRGRCAISILALALCAGCAPPPLSPSAANSQASSGNPRTAAPSAPSDASHPGSTFSSPAPLTAVQISEPAAPATVDLTARPDDIWSRIRLGFSIPDMQSPLVVDQQAWYLSHQDYLQRAFERSSHYLYHVVEELEKRHMPTELALLPFVESAYNPMAYSRARASGMWQFIPSTGKNYNLHQDFWHDERRDVLASTDAALNYLEALYELHGDWTLALASYNWGEGAVKRAIDHNSAQGKPTDYMSLNMPDETRTYYPKLQALKNIINNPGAFGVVLPRVDNQPYFVTISNPRPMDVSAAARFAEMPLDDFKALNPSFNRPVIAGAPEVSLLLPADRVEMFKTNLQSNAGPLVTWEAYRARRGERVAQIAQRFGMSVAALCEANGLSGRERLRPGEALLVQKHTPAKGAANATQSLASVQNANVITMVATPVSLTTAASGPVPGGSARSVSSSSYVVRSGDTLSSIADHFNTSVDAIKRANHLRNNNIGIGQKLVVDAGGAGAPSVAHR